MPLAELIGRLGVLGVLLHGRRNLFHRGRGLFQAGGLLLGALRQIGGAGGDFGRGVGDLARGGLDLANGRADPLGRLVGVILQDREVALILGGDALRQIAFGERIEHFNEVVERLGHVLAQRIDRAADVEHKSALAFEIDALPEVAGHRRLDDAAYCRLELGGHFLHRRFAFGASSFIPARPFLPLRVGPFSAALTLKVSTASAISPILVLAAKARQHHGEIAIGQFSHRTRSSPSMDA